MRRLVSHTSPAEKITWFSWTPSSTSSLPAAMRTSSWSARAGMIASRSGPDAESGVSFTASRYESVAAITSLSPSKRTRTPVRTGRDSSREARADLVDRLEERRRLDRWSGTSSGGRRGKSSAL